MTQLPSRQSGVECPNGICDRLQIAEWDVQTLQAERDTAIEAAVYEMRRERDAARGAIDSIMEAIKGDRFRDNLNQCAEDYVRYTLGTAGHLYHVEGYMEMVKERDTFRALCEQVDAHYSGSLDHQPAYVGRIREALSGF